MKGKILIVSLIAVFCVFMSACGCSNEEANPVKDPITHETDAGTNTTQDDKDNDKADENKDNNSGNTGSGSSSSSNSSSTSKPSNGGSSSSSSSNSGSSEKNNTIVTPAPTFEIPEPENTPTPPRRSSSSNLRVD